MLLGPLNVIPAFAAATREKDEAFKRATAIQAIAIAAVVLALLCVAGTSLLAEYEISIDGVYLAVALVLLLSALNKIFGNRPHAHITAKATPLQTALAPLVTPVIIPAAGVGALLAFVMLSPQYPGGMQAIVVALTIIVVLDFLVMFFNSAVIRIPGLMMLLQLLGDVLIFIQVALAMETMIAALRSLGIAKA